MGNSIRVLFFNLRFTLYLLRIIILSALVATVTSISIFYTYYDPTPIQWTALLALIIVHHVPLACEGGLKYFPIILDLAMAMAETGAMIFYSWKYLHVEPWVPEVVVYHAAASWALTGCLALLTVFRLASVIRSQCRGKSVFSRTHIFADLWPPKEEVPTIVTLFIGRTFWKRHFKGEARLVRILRGIFGLGFVVLLVFYAMIHMIFQPIRETSLTPIREYRTAITPDDYKIDNPVWNIVIGPMLIQNDEALQQAIIDSVDIVSLGPVPDPDTQRLCDKIVDPLPPKSELNGSIATFVTYQCYTILRFSDNTFDQDIQDGLLITMNHTSLPHNEYNVAVKALNVVVGLSNQTTVGVDVLMAKSTSISILPGANLVAAVSMNIREVFVHPGIAAFGVYQLSKALWIATITSMYPDPSPGIIHNPAVSTLRLYLQNPDPTDLIISSDERTNTVLGGFSGLGGLWTSLGGLFAIMFGGTLLHYLYGSKDISIFGAAHSLNQEELRDAFLKDYPDITTEQQNRGLLAFIREHIINLDFVYNNEGTHAGREPPPLPADTEKNTTGKDTVDIL